MSESEYKELVLEDYDRQMEAHLLPSELLVPTPAKIKAKVVKFCEQGSGLSTGDENILRSFVGERADAAAYRSAFQNGTADPFRQVVKVVAERSVNTNIKYVNLLALLIGYSLRPYHPNLNPPAQEEKEMKDNLPVKQDLKPTIPPIENGKNKTKKDSFKLLWVFAVVIVIALGWYLVSQKSSRHYTGREGCMFWNEDHYEPIDCNYRPITAPRYKLKLEQVNNFKRITRPETLSYKSIRKVWYSNYKGRVEFYTDSGANPLDTNFRVLPMTKHAYEKYVLHITN